YPLRVFAGAWFALMVVMGLADASGGVMDQVVEHVGAQLILGRYGLLTHSTGVMVHGPPNLADQVNAGVWAVATLIWTAPALAGVILAARRHQER
ncbi:hypothetical protein, partial [Longimicrobium sp.]|uniref:hypothetical protein n=1 Tax=Longimicrobium sp. TaxID=2029185 RepID=UPI002F95940A